MLLRRSYFYRNRAHIKVLLLFLFSFAIFLHWITPNRDYNGDLLTVEGRKNCFFHNGKNRMSGEAISYFEDLLTSVKQPAYDRGIFFVESSCSETGIANIKPRYACSIETVAKANPSRDIFLVFSSPVGLPRHEQNWSSTIKTLMEYSNIHFRNVQLKQLCANTPLDDWIETSPLFHSRSLYEHASDIIRTLIVYRYGGTYLDQDYMMLKNLSLIERNWIAIQNYNCLNGAAFDFLRYGIGHIVMNAALSELAENYRPEIWGWNGPDLFVRVMTKMCQVEFIEKVSDKNCRGVQVHSAKRFYPLWGKESLKFFNETFTQEVLSRTTDIMGFHFWNSQSKFIENIVMRNGTAYDIIAKKSCPRIYAENIIF